MSSVLTFAYDKGTIFSEKPPLGPRKKDFGVIYDKKMRPIGTGFEKNAYLCRLCLTNLTFTAMPKMKTNAAAKKRFTFTGTGKIKRQHAYHSHILTKKTKKQKRNLCYSSTVSPADEAKIKNLLVK